MKISHIQPQKMQTLCTLHTKHKQYDFRDKLIKL